MRVKDHTFFARLYKMSDWEQRHRVGNVAPDSDGEDGDDDQDGGDGPDGDARDRQRRRAQTDGRGTGKGDAPKGRGRGQRRRDPPSEEVLLLRQWFAQALDAHDYLSIDVPSGGGDGGRELTVLQLLDLERKNVKVQTFEDKSSINVLYKVRVQPLQLWAPVPAQQCLARGSLEVFPFVDPGFADLVDVMGCDIANRSRFHKWRADVADVEGCTLLKNPQPLTVQKNLKDKDIPALCLLDELHLRGYTAVRKAVTHVPGSPLVYDGRQPTAKRNYYKAVLIKEELFAAGIKMIKSTWSASYLAVLLKTKKALPKMSAKECQKILAKLEDDYATLSSLDKLPTLPPQPMAQGLDVDEDIACDEEEIPATPLVEDDAAGSASGNEGSDVAVDYSGDDGAKTTAPPVLQPAPVDERPGAVVDRVASSVTTAMPVAVPLPARGFPDTIEGMPVRVISARQDLMHSYHDRMWVRCCNPLHVRCNRSRSIQLQVGTYGPRAAEFYLGAWLSAAHRGDIDHAKWQPSASDIREYAAARA